jgi:hypothetical protein
VCNSNRSGVSIASNAPILRQGICFHLPNRLLKMSSSYKSDLLGREFVFALAGKVGMSPKYWRVSFLNISSLSSEFDDDKNILRRHSNLVWHDVPQERTNAASVQVPPPSQNASCKRALPDSIVSALNYSFTIIVLS